jgi:translation elongation factor EF-G
LSSRKLTSQELLVWNAQASPIVRVAVEPARPGEMAALEEGLRLLNRADPFVEVSLQDSGEHVIGAAGARARPALPFICVHAIAAQPWGPRR